LKKPPNTWANQARVDSWRHLKPDAASARPRLVFVNDRRIGASSQTMIGVFTTALAGVLDFMGRSIMPSSPA
jgi:hypothetical protein